MSRRGWGKAAIVSGLVAALCCFTPLGVMALAALGLASYAVWIDAIALPVMALSLITILLVFSKKRTVQR